MDPFGARADGGRQLLKRPSEKLLQESGTPHVVVHRLSLLVGLLCLLAANRLLAALLFLGIVAVQRPRMSRRRLALSLLAWALFLAGSLSPVDVSLVAHPGPPRFVRYVAGLPTADGQWLIARGEAIWGGCARRGNAPKWVWVW